MANQHLNLNSECLNFFSAPFRRCGRHVFQNHLKTQEAFIITKNHQGERFKKESIYSPKGDRRGRKPVFLQPRE